MDKKIYVIPLFIFGAFIISLYLVVPLYKQYLVSQRGVKQLQSDIESKQNYYNSLKNVKVDLADYQTVLGKIDDAVPSNLFPAELLNYFQSGASDSGLLLSSISMGPEAVLVPGSDRVKTSSMNVILIGSVNSFYNFLKTIEKSTRFFEIDVLDVAIDQGQTDLNSFKLTIKTFSY